jgi:hypothetical protein
VQGFEGVNLSLIAPPIFDPCYRINPKRHLEQTR